MEDATSTNEAPSKRQRMTCINPNETPKYPHYSDLQPIELVWAIVKGEVGRQYSTDINFKILLERLQAAFRHLTSHQVQGCINKANEKLRQLYEDILAEDSLDESSDENEEYDEQSEEYDSSE